MSSDARRRRSCHRSPGPRGGTHRSVPFDPGAPITAVAKHAGVGISALYSRYGSKEELLRTLCAEGLERFITIAEQALANPRDPWTVFTSYTETAVLADTSAPTLALAGTFTPTPAMYVRATCANELSVELFDRVRPALRKAVVVHDLSLIFEQLAAIRLGDDARTDALRRRYLAMLLEGLRAEGDAELPGEPPTWQEINARWSTTSRDG